MEKVALVSTMSSRKRRFWLLSRSMLISASVSLQIKTIDFTFARGYR